MKIVAFIASIAFVSAVFASTDLEQKAQSPGKVKVCAPAKRDLVDGGLAECKQVKVKGFTHPAASPTPDLVDRRSKQ
jgi:hypothetical protein